MGLDTASIAKLAASFVRSCDPVKQVKRRCPTRKPVSHNILFPNTLDPMTTARPEVSRWGKVLSEMVGYGEEDIPPQALTYAFETHSGPGGDDPGILLRGLMQRFERCVGVGDVLRDATTSAKVNGGISDFSWEKYIRPFFDKVRELIFFEESLTECAKDANARRERMVPYAQFITWAVKSDKEYPTGRSVLTTMLRPQLAEFVRSCCDLTSVLGNLFHHNLDGVATDVRENVKLVVSWIIDATVVGKSKLGNKNGILHHTRGGLKIIVNGRASRSPYSIEEFLLMTGNDHFLEV